MSHEEYKSRHSMPTVQLSATHNTVNVKVNCHWHIIITGHW